MKKGVPDEELKQHIKKHIRAAHQRKRQPYVDLLNELRMQRPYQSFAA
jgi:predicted small metal-binding protein